MSFDIGFTGTQRGMTQKQIENLHVLLTSFYRFPSEEQVGYFHHGDCIGADARAAFEATLLGYPIYLHPPEDSKKRAFTYAQVEDIPKPYLIRNHLIVVQTKVLIACPGEKYEVLRSGTWATIRYARKMHKLIYVLWP